MGVGGGLTRLIYCLYGTFRSEVIIVNRIPLTDSLVGCLAIEAELKVGMDILVIANDTYF